MSTKIIGLGNLLMGDDGVGIHLTNELLKMQLPDNVEVIDGGNCGLGLITLMEGADKVIFVDAIDSTQEPGSIVKIDPRQMKLRERSKAFSPHSLSLLKVLELAATLGYKQEIIIIGITPLSIEHRTCLSPQVQASLPKVIDSIFQELPGGANL